MDEVAKAYLDSWPKHMKNLKQYVHHLRKLTVDDTFCIICPTEGYWNKAQRHAFKNGIVWQGGSSTISNNWSHYKDVSCIFIRDRKMSYGGLHTHGTGGELGMGPDEFILRVNA